VLLKRDNSPSAYYVTPIPPSDANAELERRVTARTAELEGEAAQRRRAEKTLRASEERWRSMFEASAVGIALTDDNQRFVAFNEAFQKMLAIPTRSFAR
jgi:PAS domain-containing protein